jgi:hypothetical protein
LHSDNSVALKKKSPLPAHVDICAAGELDCFGYLGNLHHAHVFGTDGNARAYARMFGFRRT